MDAGGKILVGAAAASLLALIGHFVTGPSFIDQLEARASTELAAQGLDGVDVTLGRDPLSRTALLDGKLTGDTKAQALAAVAGVPGIAGAKWLGDPAAAPAVAAAEAERAEADGAVADADGEVTPVDTAIADRPPASAAVTKCQGDVDTLLERKKLSFRSGSAWLSAESRAILDEVATVIKPCADARVEVGGHTDDDGNREVNRILSQERADRVRAALVERGVPEALITAKGYGATKPLVAHGGAAADARNRRIEFNVTDAN